MSEHPASTDPLPTSPVPVDLRDYVRFDQHAAVRVRVFSTDVLTLDLWCLEPQQATEVLVYDDADVIYTVIGGRSWFVTDAGEIGLDAMGSLLVPAGTAHGVDNRAPDPLIVLAAGSPPDGAPGSVDLPVAEDRSAVREDDGVGLAQRLRARLGGRAVGT